MTNHVHLIVKPEEGSNLSRAIGETHRRYTRRINFREQWRGYLWQGRFASFPMDEPWLLQATACVEYNPVAAGMVIQPWEYPWSSVHAHLAGTDPQGIVEAGPLLDMVGGDWPAYLRAYRVGKDEDFAAHERTGRPLGDEGFIERIERVLDRSLKKKSRGQNDGRGIKEEARKEMETAIVAAPDAAPVIRGTAGIRKLRWAGSGRGKRGGIRVIYFWHAPPKLSTCSRPMPKEDKMTSPPRI